MNNEPADQNTEKQNFFVTAYSWCRKYPIIFNLLLMFIVGLIAVWCIMAFLGDWTLHGHETEVPNVKGMNIHIARGTLERDGMPVFIADSIFDTTQLPGTVVDQNPKPGSRVKPGRSVYVTIVAYSPKMVTFPDIVNTSLRQGESMLQGAGLKNIIIKRVPSEYADLVMGALLDGRELTPGKKIPVNSTIVLEVGSGLAEDSDLEDIIEINDL